MLKVDGVPLYVQLREGLREELSHMQPGQLIPAEGELQSKFRVSRITVRRAIDDLVAEGLLVRQQGRGTFAQKPKLTHELMSITSWTEQLQALGFTPRTAHQEIREVEVPERVGHALGLEKGARVMMMRRVRLASDEPVTLMTNYLPSRLVPRLEEKALLHESLYETLEEEYGLVPASAVNTVEARTSTHEEAQQLKIQPWAPVICVTRISYLEDQQPLELAQAISRADRYEYRVRLTGRARRE